MRLAGYDYPVCLNRQEKGTLPFSGQVHVDRASNFRLGCGCRGLPGVQEARGPLHSACGWG